MNQKRNTISITGAFAGFFTGFLLMNKNTRTQMKKRLRREFNSAIAVIFPHKFHGICKCSEPAGSSNTPNYSETIV